MTTLTPPNNLSADFAIQIDFQKGEENPSRVFKCMTELIERFQEIDKDLAGSIDVKIEPVMALEEIESGSITVWLRSALDAVEDSALKNLNWKPAVGKYLVKAKYLLN